MGEAGARYNKNMSRLDSAFQKIHREDFLPEKFQGHAEMDTPIPIGFGQTNSQPSTVYQMLKWLDARKGDRVLDVGSGSGWTTALLAAIVGQKGYVYGVEKIPELVEFGRNNCSRLSIKNVRFFQSLNTFGLPECAPFDRILVSASAQKLPFKLISQLVIGGKLVIPVQNTILEILKTTNTEYEITEHPGYIFVPLM